MSNLATSVFVPLVSWEEFQLLPDLDNGEHYELHDGEVVVVPPPRPRHVGVQMRLPKLLRFVEEFSFEVHQEFSYRPALNYQFWRADVAIVSSGTDIEIMNWHVWQVYSPPMIIEILSPSDHKRKDRNTNTPEKISKQRIVAMSNGTREFWVIDADKRTVHVTTPEGVKLYGPGELLPCSLAPGRQIAVDAIFEG